MRKKRRRGMSKTKLQSTVISLATKLEALSEMVMDWNQAMAAEFDGRHGAYYVAREFAAYARQRRDRAL